MQHHKYGYNDLEDMMPWERAFYVTLLVQWIEEENERIRQQNLQNR